MNTIEQKKMQFITVYNVLKSKRRYLDSKKEYFAGVYANDEFTTDLLNDGISEKVVDICISAIDYVLCFKPYEDNFQHLKTSIHLAYGNLFRYGLLKDFPEFFEQSDYFDEIKDFIYYRYSIKDFTSIYK